MGFFRLSRFMAFAMSTPEAVEIPKATTPRARIMSVSTCRKRSPDMVMPTLVPRKMVTALMISFCDAFDSRSATPHSRKKLPNISMPMSAEAGGTRSTHKTVTRSANRSFSRRDTERKERMRISRSLRVVSKRMIGGWMRGTSAM